MDIGNSYDRLLYHLYSHVFIRILYPKVKFIHSALNFQSV